MAPSPQSLLNRAADSPDLAGILKQGIGATLLAVSAGVVSGVLSFFELITRPLDALAGAAASLTTAIFGSPAEIIISGADETAASLTGAFSVGPGTFALAIASVLAGLWIVNAYLSEEETGNLIPGLPDIPTPGLTDSEEDGGD
jgi:hypothetical protein